MVRAILEGRKTQTRRIVKPQPDENGLSYMRNAPLDWRDDVHGHWNRWKGETPNGDTWRGRVQCWPGDRLWVREVFALEATNKLYSWHLDGRPHQQGDEKEEFGITVPRYRATDEDHGLATEEQFDEGDTRTRWKPSIHMPRWASRITLEVQGVRVERLQVIREDDARAEGVGEGPQEGWVTGPVVAFADLWDSINGPDAWLANPWVWVVEFKVIRP